MDGKIKNFHDLDAWKKAHKFTLGIYAATKEFPKEETYGIISQMRRACFSISANIAEGFSRYHYKDKIRFYHNSRGSVCEVQNFLFLARDLVFLTDKEFKKLFNVSEDINKLINGLIRSIENQK
ncbi:MAG: four helix bundle protein [Candidatus Omnitrophica bacterium]|nr:four helix bundle protein [Candidatus Omnitrophota bacterium]